MDWLLGVMCMLREGKDFVVSLIKSSFGLPRKIMISFWKKNPVELTLVFLSKNRKKITDIIRNAENYSKIDNNFVNLIKKFPILFMFLNESGSLLSFYDTDASPKHCLQYYGWDL